MEDKSDWNEILEIIHTPCLK